MIFNVLILDKYSLLFYRFATVAQKNLSPVIPVPTYSPCTRGDEKLSFFGATAMETKDFSET
jgi:hypothetical protein